MKRILMIVSIFLMAVTLPANAKFVNGVKVYYSNDSPGMAGVHGAYIRFYNNTDSYINCRIISTVTGQWKSTGTLYSGHFLDIDLPNGPYSWTCWYI